MRVLITGGNGFIGSHLAESLMRKGHDVSLFDTRFGDNTRNVDCAKFRGDVRDSGELEKITIRPDIIFHGAAVSRVVWGEENPSMCVEVNTVGSLNVAQWASKFSLKPHMILASSREVYGEPDKVPVREESPKKPVSVYGISKLMAEDLLKHVSHDQELGFTIIRFSNVYGSKRDLPQRVIPEFFRNALQGKELEVFGGKQVIDFCFIDDAISGILRVMERIEMRDETVQNNDFNLTTAVGHSIRELAELVTELTKSESRIAYREARGYDMTRFVGDYSKARSLFGYVPQVELRAGLKKFLRDLKS